MPIVLVSLGMFGSADLKLGSGCGLPSNIPLTAASSLPRSAPSGSGPPAFRSPFGQFVAGGAGPAPASKAGRHRRLSRRARATRSPGHRDEPRVSGCDPRARCRAPI